MELNYNIVILILVLTIIGVLVYSYNTGNNIVYVQAPSNSPNSSNPPNSSRDMSREQYIEMMNRLNDIKNQPPQMMRQDIIITRDDDPYSDHIKKQDLHNMLDPLTYPQQRLPRHVLEQYTKYFGENGRYPPFGFATQPQLFDNPTSVGYLMLVRDQDLPYDPLIPTSIPLFMIRSSKNNNRYFYYIIDQRPLNQINAKIPLDNVRINGIKYPKADFYGIPELYDDDIVEDINIYPGKKFTSKIYKTYFFP